MFNFTTLTVFNSVKLATTAQIKNKTVKDYNIIKGGSQENPEIRIGNIRFNKADIIDIQMKKHTVESLAKVEFDLSTVKTLVEADSKDVFAGNYRIVLYLGLSMNSQDSFYSNDFVYKGKPLFIEFPVKAEDTPEDVAARIVKIANKYMLFVAQDKILDVTANKGVVTFEGIDGYQLIKKAVLQKYDPNANLIDCCNNNGDFIDIITGVPAMYELDNTGKAVLSTDENNNTTVLGEDGVRALAANEVAIAPGIEAFADYNWIIHNLRLPTLANTYFWAPNKSEFPIVGGEYTQFIVRMCKERDGIAGHVVGQRATSVTTHVFYVLDQGNNVATFTQELRNLVTAIKTDADTSLSDPYANA